MSVNHSEISSFVFKIADKVLRGPFKPKEYGDVILPFIVLRRLDCVLEKHKDTVIELYNEYKSQVEDPYPIITGKIKNTFFNYSQYDLKRLRQDPSNVMINFKNYLNGYSYNVIEIIDNFEFDVPLKRLEDNDRLFQFIEIFSEIDLHPDVVSNHQMGQIFEELLRRFSELSNESSGEHYTPRDIVQLIVSMVFSQDSENLQGEGKIKSIYDPCCGTGGMLTLGKEWVHRNINDKLEFRLLGQEFNPQTYSICKSDMMISGDDPENIKYGSSLSKDGFQGEKFDYMITNPPYGEDWNSDKKFVKNESENPNGRFSVGLPPITDGQLLFVQHMISKMESKGSRIGVVLNGSPMFTGDAGSGSSNIRKWIIESDMLDCIVSLPDQLFFNTKISTYIWILTNKKQDNRKGKVQLIDGSSLFTIMKKSLGDKRKVITEEGNNKILETYNNFVENEYSQIHDNEYFGYTKVTIEGPKIEGGEIVTNKQGKPKPDTSKRNHEWIPLTEDIADYFEREVKPHLPNSWMDESKNRVGYEINFDKYFYKYKPLRSLNEITQDLLKLDENSENLLKDITDKKHQSIIDVKDSGVEWIGKIPSEWKTKKLKYIGNLYGGLTGKSGKDFNNENNINNKPFVPFTNICNNTYISNKHLPFVNIEPGERQNKVKKNDLFFLMSSEGYDDLGKSSILIEEIDELYLNSFCKGFRVVSKKINPLFINYQLLGDTHRKLISVEGKGFTRINLRQNKLSNTYMFTPEIKVQDQIVDYLDEENLKIDKLIDFESKRIELLKEYRQSLTSNLVTGKVNIE